MEQTAESDRWLHIRNVEISGDQKGRNCHEQTGVQECKFSRPRSTTDKRHTRRHQLIFQATRHTPVAVIELRSWGI